MWALPILGFIGTVLGLGDAIGGFSGALDQTHLAEEGSYTQALDSIKIALGGVTTGLAEAFNTTLIALVASLLIMFPASALQKQEEALLAKVEDYCDESLIRRLDDGSAGSVIEEAIRRQIEEVLARTLAEHHARFRSEAERFEGMGETVARSVVEGWETALAQVKERHLRQVEELREALENRGRCPD